MATVSATSRSAGINNFASGSFTSDNTITEVTLGFTPRYIKVINSTDNIQWDKIEGMAAANSMKTVGGTVAITVDTTGAITIAAGSMSLSAAAVGSAKAISWVAFG